MYLKFWYLTPKGHAKLHTRFDNPHNSVITSISYDPNSHTVVTSSMDRKFKIWENVSLNPARQVLISFFLISFFSFAILGILKMNFMQLFRLLFKLLILFSIFFNRIRDQFPKRQDGNAEEKANFSDMKLALLHFHLTLLF